MLAKIQKILEENTGDIDIRFKIKAALRKTHSVVWTQEHPKIFMIKPKKSNGRLYGCEFYDTDGKLVAKDIPETRIETVRNESVVAYSLFNGSNITMINHNGKMILASTGNILPPNATLKANNRCNTKKTPVKLYPYFKALFNPEEKETKIYSFYDPCAMNVVYYGQEPIHKLIATTDGDKFTLCGDSAGEDEKCGIIYISEEGTPVINYSSGYQTTRGAYGNIPNIFYVALKYRYKYEEFSALFPNNVGVYQDVMKKLKELRLDITRNINTKQYEYFNIRLQELFYERRQDENKNFKVTNETINYVFSNTETAVLAAYLNIQPRCRE